MTLLNFLSTKYHFDRCNFPYFCMQTWKKTLPWHLFELNLPRQIIINLIRCSCLATTEWHDTPMEATLQDNKFVSSSPFPYLDSTWQGGGGGGGHSLVVPNWHFVYCYRDIFCGLKAINEYSWCDKTYMYNVLHTERIWITISCTFEKFIILSKNEWPTSCN